MNIMNYWCPQKTINLEMKYEILKVKKGKKKKLKKLVENNN